MTNTIRVAILFGGKSAEHEVSIRSARSIAEAMDKKKYSPLLLGIDKHGKWWYVEDLSVLLDSTQPTIDFEQVGVPIALIPESRGDVLNVTTGQVVAHADVVFPILHGPFGEDGTVQGLLKLAQIAFVGSGILGSAMGMDKEVMKRVLREAGIPIGKFITVEKNTPCSFEEAIQQLGNPLFIKPANLGSSVGVSKVRTEAEYTQALQEAFRYDTKVLIEEFIAGREIECAVLGDEDIKASLPGEIKPTHDFYSYEAKYLDENGAALEIPVELPEEVTQRIQELSIQTCKVLCCYGLSRVDFFLTESGELFVNEINTMPGFTSISMYPKLWEATGITYSDLIDQLIQLAQKRFTIEQQLHTSV